MLVLSEELLRFLSLRTRYACIALETLTEQAFSGEHLAVPRIFLENAVSLLSADETWEELTAVDSDAAMQGEDLSFGIVSMAWPRARPSYPL